MSSRSYSLVIRWIITSYSLWTLYSLPEGSLCTQGVLTGKVIFGGLDMLARAVFHL